MAGRLKLVILERTRNDWFRVIITIILVCRSVNIITNTTLMARQRCILILSSCDVVWNMFFPWFFFFCCFFFFFFFFFSVRPPLDIDEAVEKN